MLLFTLGAVVMRGAGCIINDLIDQDIDAKVTRTQNRPLVTGAVSRREAFLLLFVLLAIGATILCLLNTLTFILGVIALIPVCLYPLMKRITYWPQAFLGLTFNWGALMGWTAVTGHFHLAAFLLYAAGVCWTLGYDTIYAHQDKESDTLIGVKSTALKWGDDTKKWLVRFYKLTAMLLVLASGLTATGAGFYALWIVACCQLYWQVQNVKLDEPEDCLKKFRSNTLFGGIVFAAIIAGKVL